MKRERKQKAPEKERKRRDEAIGDEDHLCLIYTRYLSIKLTEILTKAPFPLPLPVPFFAFLFANVFGNAKIRDISAFFRRVFSYLISQLLSFRNAMQVLLYIVPVVLVSVAVNLSRWFELEINQYVVQDEDTGDNVTVAGIAGTGLR